MGVLLTQRPVFFVSFPGAPLRIAALYCFCTMATNRKHNKFVAEEPYILRIRDPELAQQIRSTLQNEGEAANRKLEIIFDGMYRSCK
jgi:hypothetical protein